MKIRRILAIMALAIAGVSTGAAQISDIINGITNAAMPAIVGGPSYKGYVEADYTQGFGNYRTNFLTLSTSQGYKFNEWFYMGAGLGVDLLWSTINNGWGSDWAASSPEWIDHQHTTEAVMIPVFTDFRFLLGLKNELSFFINLRLGAAFLCSDSYVQIRDGYLTNKDYFYFQPALGVRIPVNRTHPKQAVDIGVHYRLMTSDYWSYWQYSAAINGLGVNVSFEW